MTICLLCPADITDPIKQFGDTHAPICQSCYLADNSWVTELPAVVNNLQHGIDLETALILERRESVSDLQKFAEGIFSELFEVAQ